MKNPKFKKKLKISSIILLLFVALFIAIAVPSLARYKNRSSIADADVWDGSVASSYRKGSGTVGDPYVISNGAEFAHFQKELENTNYENTYFVLGSDIVLNDGIFAYDATNGITYTKDNNTVSVSPYQDSYQGLHEFSPIKQFKGNFNGNGYRIYGLFITKNTNDPLGLFLNLEGTVSNFYLTNSIIYGGSVTGGIAGKAKNATISDVMVQGSVVGKTEAVESQFFVALEDVSKTIDNATDTEVISVPHQKIGGKITSIQVTGNLVVSDEVGTVTLNGQSISSGNFDVSLGTSIDDFTFEFTSTDNTTYEITNLRYAIGYRYGNSSGIVSEADHVTFQNISQRASVYASVYAAGISNDIVGGTTLSNVYNAGVITGNVGSGLINRIDFNDSTSSIKNCYNSGEIYATKSYGFLASIENSTVVIENSFNQNDNFVLGNIVNSNVTVQNVSCSTNNYVSNGVITGSIGYSADLVSYAKTIGFDEFIDSTDLANNPTHIWVYDGSNLPILALDDIHDSIATIHVSDHSWNNLGYELNSLKFTSLSFTIQEVDSLKPIKSVSYYIHKSKTPLRKSEIEAIDSWESYSNVVSISEEGFYIVYAKVTDMNDQVIYINTDLLILDLSGSSITMSVDEAKWTDVSSSVSTKYYPSNKNLTIEAVDELSGVKSISYYISDSLLTKEELESDLEWQNYSGSILIDSTTGVIVYAKVIDNTNYVSYANTDRFLIGGYQQTSMVAGRSTTYSTNVMITDKSSVSMYYSFSDKADYPNGITHSISFTKTLPENTMITILDRNRSKTYKYTTTSADSCKILFTSFREVGSTNHFKESVYTGSIEEDYKIIVDFSKTELESNIKDLSATLSISKGEDSILETIGNPSSFQVVRNSDANSTFTSDYGDTIYYNTDATYSIPITGSLQFATYQSSNVIDTTLEDKRFGLACKLVDSNGNTVSKNYLQNIKFRIGSKYFFMDNDGVVRMDLGVGLGNVDKDFVIETMSSNIELPNGTYTFQIGYFMAFDGTYSRDITYFKDIPVTVADSSYQKMLNFQIRMDDEDRIMDRVSSKQFVVGVLQNTSYSNANVKVRLLRKSSFEAIDQTYTEIDFSKYSNADLTLYKDSIFNTIITSNQSSYRDVGFDLNTESLGSGAYSLSFDLYDGNTYVKSIVKKFIIR